MLGNSRFIFSDNGTLNDYSHIFNDFSSQTQTIPVVAAEDYLYLGTDLPFNHRWFEVSAVNSNASVASVEIWDGNSWVSAVDVVDQTSSGGVAFAQSGYVSWSVDRNSGWGQESTTEDITGLTTAKIYDLYWARLSWSADLSASTALKFIGFKFASDNDLGAYYPDLNLSGTKTAFESGKTDWNEQHFLAAEEIIRYLRKKNIIWSRNQILDYNQFNLAGIHKVAEIIMNSFGDDFEDNRNLAKQKFYESINLGIFRTDRDEDGRLEEREKRDYAGLVRR